MIRMLIALIYILFIPYGAFKFSAGGGVDWLIFSISGLLFWVLAVSERINNAPYKGE